VGHKKRGSKLFAITFANIGQFQYFLHQNN